MQNDRTERQGVHLVGLAAANLGVIFRELPTSDQGIDGQLELIDAHGSANGRLIAVQIKSGLSWFREVTEDAYIFRPSQRHRDYWIKHSLPVIVILCNPDSQQCHWELVAHETCSSTGDGWRIDIPKSKTLSSLRSLGDIAAPVAATSDFTVAQTNDVSTGLARRISLDVIVHPTPKPMSKIQLAAIVRTAVTFGQETDYARNDVSAAAHAGKPADMVSGFVYLREVDRSSAQWVCRFQWISKSINEQARYQGVSGEIDSEGLIIEWQLNRPIAKLLDKRRRGKGEYLKLVDQLLMKVPAVVERLSAFHSNASPTEDTLTIAELGAEFEQSWDDSRSAPAECQRLNQALGELLTLIGNLQFVWGEDSTYSRPNAEHQSRMIERELARVRTEISFLRREAR